MTGGVTGHGDAVHQWPSSAQQPPSDPVIFLQSIVELATGRLYGVEALARFPESQHRTTTQVFAAERAAGRGAHLEAMCLRAALARRYTLPASTLLAVNLSPDATSHPAVLSQLDGDLRGLIIEITEEPVTDSELVIERIRRMREHGALIAVDDASTGYAGLMRLGRVRPDIIKLDRELVAGVGVSPEKAAVLQALVGLARRLDSLVLAEGVESLQQVPLLAAMGVDLLQGWAISPPAATFDTVAASVTATCLEARARLLSVETSPRRAEDAGPRDIYPVAAALASAARYSDFVAALTDATTVLGAATIGLSLLTEHDTLREVAASNSPADPIEYRLTDYPATASALRDRTMLEVYRDDPSADPAELALLHRDEMASLLLVPLALDDATVGILEIFYATDGRRTAQELADARRLAELVTFAVGRLS